MFERQTLLLVSGVFFYIPCFLETPSSSSSFSAAFTLEASIETMSDKRRTKRTENEQNNGIQFSPAFFDCQLLRLKLFFFLLSLFSFLLSRLKFHHWLKKPLKRIRRKWKLCSTFAVALNCCCFWGKQNFYLLRWFIASVNKNPAFLIFKAIGEASTLF